MKQVDEWGWGLGLAANFPAHENIDITLSFSSIRFSGDVLGRGAKGTGYNVGVWVRGHFFPEEPIHPFAAIGFLYRDVHVEWLGFKGTFDDVGVGLEVGAQFEFTERTALTASLAYIDVMGDDVIVGCGLNHWFAEMLGGILSLNYGLDSEAFTVTCAAVVAF